MEDYERIPYKVVIEVDIEAMDLEKAQRHADILLYKFKKDYNCRIIGVYEDV